MLSCIHELNLYTLCTSQHCFCSLVSFISLLGDLKMMHGHPVFYASLVQKGETKQPLKTGKLKYAELASTCAAAAYMRATMHRFSCVCKSVLVSPGPKKDSCALCDHKTIAVTAILDEGSEHRALGDAKLSMMSHCPPEASYVPPEGHD